MIQFCEKVGCARKQEIKNMVGISNQLEKFDGKGNFSVWQCVVKDVSVKKISRIRQPDCTVNFAHAPLITLVGKVRRK